MLSLLAVLVVAPVQDRAVSVAEFIKSFDDDKVKHTASEQMGEHIIFVHAPDQQPDAIKARLADALSASWRKTETGFRLERTQAQTRELERNETAVRAAIFEDYKQTVRKKLADSVTAEKRANSALQSLLKFQETYRISRPTSFKPETELPADWLLFSLLENTNATEIASAELGEGIQMSNRPAGTQRALPPAANASVANYERDRREVADFSDTILNATANGPMTDWIAKEIESVRRSQSVDRVLYQYGRGSDTLSVGVFVFNAEGDIFDQSVVWIPSVKVETRIEVPTGLTVELNEVQFSFVDTAYGYTFVRDPRPEGIDKISGAEPLCAVEPLFSKFAGFRAKPFIAVLDDRLLNAFDRATGRIKNVGSFVLSAEDLGALSMHKDDSWALLRPEYLLDTEARRFDRSAIAPFLKASKKAGYVPIEAHVAVSAASPYSIVPLPTPIFMQLDRSGYVLVKEPNVYLPRVSRILQGILKLRGGVSTQTLEIPASSLPSSVKDQILRWARNGAASLQARTGQSASSLELNGNYALPNGLRADSIVRIIPTTTGCVGLKEPFPNAYTAEELGWMCGGMATPPSEVISGAYWYGERRGLRLEILLTPKAMLTNEYFESAGEMKEMRGYNSLPEEFRKQVAKSYEEMRKLLGGGN